MTNEEMKEIVSGILPDTLICYDVNNVNHKPHVYMITNKHIANSKGMYLDVNSAKCGHKNCNLSYEQHTSDKIVFLQLKQDIDKGSMQIIAEKIIKALPEKSVDGFSFIDTKEKFRII